MNKIPHRLNEIIKAWAGGENIQWHRIDEDPRMLGSKWNDWDQELELNIPPFNNTAIEWRIKPKILDWAYRNKLAISEKNEVGLNISTTYPSVVVVQCPLDQMEEVEEISERSPSFVQWLDKDWKVIQIEEIYK